MSDNNFAKAEAAHEKCMVDLEAEIARLKAEWFSPEDHQKICESIVGVYRGIADDRDQLRALLDEGLTNAEHHAADLELAAKVLREWCYKVRTQR